jgi:Putative Flp pilus-assembly TadE/G-like
MPTCLMNLHRRSQALSSSTTAKQQRPRFWRDQSGGISMIYAAVLPGLIGLVGLGVETGYWYFGKRELQTQADAAAIGGAWEIAWNREDEVESSSTNEAVRNGFPNASFTTITVNNPPTSGPEAGNDKAVEVILTQDYDPLFSGIFRSEDVRIAARAVSTLIASGSACVLALNGTVSDAAENTGATNINAPDCTIAANSDAEDAISFSGSSEIVFESAWTVGGIEIDGQADVTLTEGGKTHMWALDDPYADLDWTAPSGCDVNNQYQNINGTIDIPNGGEVTICGNITIHNGATVDFEPGTYWMKGSSLTIHGGTVTCSTCEPGGDGVTFIFTTPSNGNENQIGTVAINGSATVELNAPGPDSSLETAYTGILFAQDPDAPTQSNKSANLNGGASTILNGAIYFPSNELHWAGNNSLAATCTLLIADTVTFEGSSGLSIADCESQGIDLGFTQRIALVE